jgi:hypothetical protein
MRVTGSAWQPADSCAHFYGLPGEKQWWMWSRPKYIQAHEALLAQIRAALSDVDVLEIDAASNRDVERCVVAEAMPITPPLACARTSQAPPHHPAPRRVTEMLTT